MGSFADSFLFYNMYIIYNRYILYILYKYGRWSVGRDYVRQTKKTLFLFPCRPSPFLKYKGAAGKGKEAELNFRRAFRPSTKTTHQKIKYCGFYFRGFFSGGFLSGSRLRVGGWTAAEAPGRQAVGLLAGMDGCGVRSVGIKKNMGRQGRRKRGAQLFFFSPVALSFFVTFFCYFLLPFCYL